jgi:hypothetical protein
VLVELLVRVGQLEQQVRRMRWARGGARVRALREELRLTRLMLARQQVARGFDSPHKLNLIGGREQLEARIAELPGVGNPYAAVPKGDA